MDDLHERVGKPLSDSDLTRLLPDHPKIIKYSELGRYNDVRELLPKSRDYVILLVEQKLNRGHWVALLRNGNMIEYFDPYGYRPDKALLWTPRQLRKRLGQDEPHLSHLLNKAKDDGMKVVFGETSYQKRDDPGVQTCGRHLVMRIRHLLHNEDSSPKTYHRDMKRAKREAGVTFDLLVTAGVKE